MIDQVIYEFKRRASEVVRNLEVQLGKGSAGNEKTYERYVGIIKGWSDSIEMIDKVRSSIDYDEKEEPE